MPMWRNWQTRWTQNPVSFAGRVGSIPTIGTNKMLLLQRFKHLLYAEVSVFLYCFYKCLIRVASNSDTTIYIMTKKTNLQYW